MNERRPNTTTLLFSKCCWLRAQPNTRSYTHMGELVCGHTHTLLRVMPKWVPLHTHTCIWSFIYLFLVTLCYIVFDLYSGFLRLLYTFILLFFYVRTRDAKRQIPNPQNGVILSCRISLYINFGFFWCLGPLSNQTSHLK